MRKGIGIRSPLTILLQFDERSPTAIAVSSCLKPIADFFEGESIFKKEIEGVANNRRPFSIWFNPMVVTSELLLVLTNDSCLNVDVAVWRVICIASTYALGFQTELYPSEILLAN